MVHNYTVSGSLILTEEWGENLVVYLYDANGEPIGMRYRTSSMAEGTFYTFWFDKNLQGDVVAVYNETGTKVLSYTYDAWGNKTTTVHNSSGTNSYAQYNATLIEDIISTPKRISIMFPAAITMQKLDGG